jgi:hypothetical protein
MSNITPIAKPVGDNVSCEDMDEAWDLLYETRILGKLLKRLGENHEDMENSDLNDLGRLLLRLTEQPLSVVDSVMHDKRDAQGDSIQ